jgi:hypothetical protein
VTDSLHDAPRRVPENAAANLWPGVAWGWEGPSAPCRAWPIPQYKPSHVATAFPPDAAGGLALFASEEEAAEIYARVCRSWYGAKAKSVVDAKIRALQAKADYKGVEA